MTNSTSNSPIIIGHRGAAGYVLENTLESIKKAISLKVDMIEIDVFRIRTGEIMVFHDDNLSRLGGVDKNIEALSKDEVGHINLRGGYKIPSLEEVLQCVSTQCRVNIELKGTNTAIGVAKTLRSLVDKEYSTLDNYLISSFQHQELHIMRNELDDVPIGILPIGSIESSLEIANKLNAESIHPDYSTLDKNTVTQFHQAGFKVYPWTVNTVADKLLMQEIAVDGIITDFP